MTMMVLGGAALDQMKEKMAQDLYFFPKAAVIIKLPRKSPLMMRMIMLATIMMCSIYISSVCLKHTTAQLNTQSTRVKAIGTHSRDYELVGLKKIWIHNKTEVVNKKPIEEHSYDSKIVIMKQTETQVMTEPKILRKPVDEHHYDPRVAGLKQSKIQLKQEHKTKLPIYQHNYDLRTVGFNQTEVEIKAKLVTNNLTQPRCPATGIPQSEVAFIHYPVPTNYSRRECECTPVRFYVIISMQRSGSKWLESLLNSHVNVSSNGEIFIDRERSSNVSAITRTLDKVYNLDMRNSANKKGCTSAVGFKWMLNQRIMVYREEVSNYFKQRGVSVIFLFRRNLLRRIISLIANSQDHKRLNGTHKAHVNTQHEAEMLASYKPKLNAKSLASKLMHATSRATEAIEHFKSIRHMVLYYEDLVQNNTEKLNEVMEFLRVPRRKLRSRHVKIHTRPLSQMVKNWNAVRKALKGSQFESLLTSD
ncbi:uncharacterized protein A4U43_C03F19410 [Asparagus officinalis]|uniref:Sulfotransferase n=1 Tax=Asparagus officinalis TaxID=4686 RepID=A0A5P1FFN2_ASPOF|nr:uncharacterized protein LOC109834039 [Asparagus officinalis]ONK75679.1 uncharacterized protein A4U43_C03F19410 [Asparagus officinalis]